MTPNPIAALQDLAERAIRVRDIAQPLWLVSPARTAADVAAELAARGYDVAAVDEAPVRRFVRADALRDPRGRVSGAAQVIDPADLVSGDLPLVGLLDVLSTRDRAFVLERDQITAIVTLADLQAPAVGVVALAHLVAVETALAHILGPGIGSELAALPEGRREKVRAVFDDKRARNAEIGFQDCLYFSDWLVVAGKSKELLRDLGTSAKRFKGRTGSWIEIRNDLAHGGTILDSRDPKRAIELLHDIVRLAHELWNLVDSATQPWDAFAATTIRRADRRRLPLAGPDASTRWPWDHEVHVVTAWNPASVVRPVAVNRSANEALCALLGGWCLSRG